MIDKSSVEKPYLDWRLFVVRVDDEGNFNALEAAHEIESEFIPFLLIDPAPSKATVSVKGHVIWEGFDSEIYTVLSKEAKMKVTLLGLNQDYMSDENIQNWLGNCLTALELGEIPPRLEAVSNA